MSEMRAKVGVGVVQTLQNNDGETYAENVSFYGVSKPLYDETGLDEDNTYAKYSPSIRFDITIANPALFGKFQSGQKFYVDFTEVEK